MRTGRTAFSFNGRVTKFSPVGPVNYRGRGSFRKNRVAWSASPPGPAARLFVGLNVKGDPVWSIRDVMEVVRAERTSQTGDPSSTFIAQKGLFKHSGGDVVEEDSVQVIIFDESGSPDFTEQMLDLATRLARILQQELVIVEMQNHGKGDDAVFGVAP